MLEFVKKYYYNICITAVYTFLACLVYGVWSYSAWNLWSVTLIIVVAFVAVGFLCGYVWITHEVKKQD